MGEGSPARAARGREIIGWQWPYHISPSLPLLNRARPAVMRALSGHAAHGRPHLRPLWPRLLRLLAAAGLLFAAVACGGAATPPPVDPLQAMRDAASQSSDGEVVGRWLLGELLVPGGDPARAQRARKRLDELTPAAKGMFAALGRAIDDEGHGRFRSAASAHLDALVAARQSAHPDAPLVAWFSANHLVALRASVSGLWDKAAPIVERTIQSPGKIGWRARGELIGWWSVDAFRGDAQPSGGQPNGAQAGAPAGTGEPVKGRATPPNPLEAAADRHGCIKRARIAGPFGHQAPTDHRQHFEAERPGPWPLVFTRDPRQKDAPRVLSVDRSGCALRAAEATAGGVFYVETFVDLPAEREVIVAAQGALSLFVDDVEVLTRDTRQWGIWPRFGARLRLAAGRHRVLARISGGETSIRLLASDGTPLGIQGSDDPAPPYALTPPVRLPDPNVLEPFLASLGVPPQPGTPRPAPRDVSDPIALYLAAYLAHVEGQDDVSSVLIEPLVKDQARATGPALAMQAIFFERDPIFPETDARDLMKDARARAAAKDPELWWPRFWLALDEADKVGVPEVAPKLVELANHFREVPDIWKGLSTVYARMGWRAEHARAVKETAARFPEDIEVLQALLHLYDEQGLIAEADKVADRIRKLDPASEIDFDRAIERRDYAAAIRELKRLGARRADRRDIAFRIADLLTRAGASEESIEKLEQAVKNKPADASARLALADARFARGDKGALKRALVDAIQTGSDDGAIREALELIDGTTELSPFRRDGQKVIAEFEKSGQAMPGTAARVLDYAALWVHTDGSARMLEHEIICIQSREAIQEHAEQRVPRGLILKLRTIKRDGRVLEPEFVEGKPTVTMPHLEVGDYIETESLANLRGDGEGGLRFEGPRWFFREEKLSYWLSEFVVVSPKSRPLQIETGGVLPEPVITESGALVTRRWRVDKSPALPEEPGSAPMQEFLPNVRIGWGASLERTLAGFIDAAADETPRDPRLVRVAQTIVKDASPDAASEPGKAGHEPSTPATSAVSTPRSLDEQARRIYRWVLANVEAGREGDGRRAIIGKSGNRTEAFMYLCRLLGMKVSMGLVRDRLTAPARGPFSEAESFNALAVRLVTESGPRWMIVRDKFAPFGYLPSSLRGQPAVVLEAGAPRETTPRSGTHDGVTHEGTAELAADGSATLDIEQRYEGKLAIGLRTALETLPDARLKETIESRLLPQTLPGARLLSLEVKNLAELDAPLILAMKVKMASFARVRGGELVISPPFPMRLAALASLPTRETPLYISEQIASRSTVLLRVTLPERARPIASLAPVSLENDGRSVIVKDRVEKGVLVFERSLDIPAGRVQTDAYPDFQGFVRRADAALSRDVIVSVEPAAQIVR